MHAILVSVGTDGDVLPFVALGTRLRARGHRITLVANEHYGALAANYGFGFRALISDEETNELIGNPDVWHPIKSAIVGARWARRAIGRQYGLLLEVARDEDAVLVAYPPVFAARLVQEKLACPLASYIPMPWMIVSAFNPPAMSAFNLPRWIWRPAIKLQWRLLEEAADLLIGRYVNRVGRSLGLKPIRRVYRWSLSPQLIIGAFPAWYAPPQPDWPPQMRLAGFPLFDGENRLPQDLLDFCRAGPPPVAFTFGTGMRHGTQLFRAALESCKILGIRGVFLTKFEGQLPAPLPSFVHHCRYAPLGQLFPHCAAVVHHGGVGTTAQALASGRPQLILPMAWDQPDNARRVKRLGVGNWLRRNSGGARIASSLAEVMTHQTQVCCREIAARFGNDDPLGTAAIFVEELAQRAVGPRR